MSLHEVANCMGGGCHATPRSRFSSTSRPQNAHSILSRGSSLQMQVDVYMPWILTFVLDSLILNVWEEQIIHWLSVLSLQEGEHQFSDLNWSLPYENLVATSSGRAAHTMGALGA